MGMACEGDLIQTGRPGGGPTSPGLWAFGFGRNGGLLRLELTGGRISKRDLRPAVLSFRTECYATAAHLSPLGTAVIWGPPLLISWRRAPEPILQ